DQGARGDAWNRRCAHRGLSLHLARRLEPDRPHATEDVRCVSCRGRAAACRRSRAIPRHHPGGICRMDVTVSRAGMLTTVQDLGRRGHRAVGVPRSGAMDTFALRVANLLVGNPENTAALEFTLLGPELVFT